MPRSQPPHLHDIDPLVLFELSPAPLLALDADLRVVAATDAYLGLCGADRDSLVGQPLAAVFPFRSRPDQGEAAERSLRAIVNREEQGASTFDLQPAGPNEVSWRIHAKGMAGAGGPQVRLLSLWIERGETNDARSVTSLEAQRAELLRSNAELEQFRYIASHDMQEPIRMITSYLQILQRKYAQLYDDQARQYIGFVLGAAERMRTMVTAILEFARVGSRESVLADIDSGVNLDEALQQLAPKMEAANAQLERGDLPRVLADQSSLVCIWQNLIGNAVKFRSESPLRIRIDAVSDGNHWRFAVSDNGVGIPDAQQPRLFKLFERAHRDRFPGAGIGLATCKRLVEHQGGRIWFESRPGLGSTFSFTLLKAGNDQTI